MRWAWKAADERLIDSSGAMAVLIVLADHASDAYGEDWTCFPSFERIARRTCFDEKTVGRHVDWLLAEGWIEREPLPSSLRKGRRRNAEKGKFFYTLKRSRLGETSPDNLSGEPRPDAPDRLSGEREVDPTICPAAPDNLSAPIEEPSSEPPKSATALSGARAAFDRVSEVWAATNPDRVAPPVDWRAWLRAIGKIPPDELARAALRYLAESDDVKRGRCKALAVWLAEERWIGWLGAPPAIAALEDAPASSPSFDPDPAFLADVRAAKPADWIGSWLGPCRWNAADRAIETRTAFAADRIAGELRDVLEQHGVTVRKAVPA